jgi:hypothetical protein
MLDTQIQETSSVPECASKLLYGSFLRIVLLNDFACGITINRADNSPGKSTVQQLRTYLCGDLCKPSVTLLSCVPKLSARFQHPGRISIRFPVLHRPRINARRIQSQQTDCATYPVTWHQFLLSSRNVQPGIIIKH